MLPVVWQGFIKAFFHAAAAAAVSQRVDSRNTQPQRQWKTPTLYLKWSKHGKNTKGVLRSSNACSDHVSGITGCGNAHNVYKKRLTALHKLVKGFSFCCFVVEISGFLFWVCFWGGNHAYTQVKETTVTGLNVEVVSVCFCYFDSQYDDVVFASLHFLDLYHHHLILWGAAQNPRWLCTQNKTGLFFTNELKMGKFL